VTEGGDDPALKGRHRTGAIRIIVAFSIPNSGETVTIRDTFSIGTLERCRPFGARAVRVATIPGLTPLGCTSFGPSGLGRSVPLMPRASAVHRPSKSSSQQKSSQSHRKAPKKKALRPEHVLGGGIGCHQRHERKEQKRASDCAQCGSPHQPHRSVHP